jgi:hypothetical protein
METVALLPQNHELTVAVAASFHHSYLCREVNIYPRWCDQSLGGTTATQEFERAEQERIFKLYDQAWQGQILHGCFPLAT